MTSPATKVAIGKMAALAKIHILQKQAGLDDDTYRDLLQRETGLRSSADMTGPQRLQVISALERLVPKNVDPSRATGKFAKKLQALWIAGHNLGVIDNKSDEALIAFLKRQTGLDHHRFLQDARDANKAIDALKLMLRRQTGNDDLFRKDQKLPKLYNDFRFQICLHIWAELIKKDAAPAGTLTAWMISTIGNTPMDLTDRQWIDVQNSLGRLLRRTL
jgi:phage gp16-like protein